jgi:hypothetical protein
VFLDWAKRRIPAADIARVLVIDKRFRETARKVGLLDPKPATAKSLAQTRQKRIRAGQAPFEIELQDVAL